MSDRDELAHLIHRAEHGPHGCPYGPNDDQKAAADAILAAGFRRTVTPEQIEAADRAFCEQMAEGFTTEYALRAAFKSVGLVPEDGEQ